MNIFILEDDQRRMVYFNRSFLGDNTIHHFEDVKPAIAFLESNVNKIDRFYLDHDLGGESYVDSNEFNTGFTVAKFLSGVDMDYSKITIHSMNHPAAIRMNGVLPGSNILPFNSMYEKIT